MPSIALALEKFSKYAGGAESYALSLADTLISQGWEVHLYGKSWDGSPEKAIFHQINVPKYLPSWVQMLLFAIRHRQMVSKERHDVIVGFGNTLYMNVYQSHGGVHRYSTRRKCDSIRSPFLRLLKRILIFFSIKDRVRDWIESAPFRLSPRPRIIAISQMVVDDFISRFNVRREDITLIYNGIDLKRFHPGIRSQHRGEAREKFGVANNMVLFLFLSYTLRKKGIFPLIEATAILNERHKGSFKVVVVGKKPQQSVLNKVKEYGLDDVFLFHGSTKTPEVYFANADVFVLPTYYDTCSLVTIEAMACGLPVITSEYNGASGIVDSEIDGHIIRHPPSPGEIANAMVVYLTNKNLQEFSARATKKAQKYSLDANHNAVIRICREVALEKIN